MIKDLRKLKDDEDVKAVVLCKLTGREAPMVQNRYGTPSTNWRRETSHCFHGDYAASGGYYISCNADTIVAEPTTLTGSIGIFSTCSQRKGLTDKNRGRCSETNKYADFGTLTRPMNDGEKGW